MERGEDAGGIRRRGPNERGVETDRVVIVLLWRLGDDLVAYPADRVLLRERTLRRVDERIERRPIRVREGPLLVVDVHLVADHRLRHRRQPRVNGVAALHR